MKTNQLTFFVAIIIILCLKNVAAQIPTPIDWTKFEKPLSKYKTKTIPTFTQDVGGGKSVKVNLIVMDKAEMGTAFNLSMSANRDKIFNGRYDFKILNDISNSALYIRVRPGYSVLNAFSNNYFNNGNRRGIINIPDENVPPNCIRGRQSIDITSPDFSIIGNSNYLNKYTVGMVYNLKSIISDNVITYPNSRTPINIFAPGSATASVQVTNPNPSNEHKLNNAVQILKSQIPNINPQIDFSDLQETFSNEDFYIKLTLGGRCPYGTIDAMFSNNSSNSTRRFFYDFKNEMFTIKATMPEFNKFFDNISKQDSIKIYEDGAYLNQVTYGRRLIISIETSKMTSDLKADIAATFKYALYGAQANLNYEQKKLRESLHIKALVLGGNVNEGSAIPLNNIEDVRNLIQRYINNRDVNTALPIAHSFTDLYGQPIGTNIKPLEDISYEACFNPTGKLKIEVVSLTAHGKNFDLSGRSIIRVYNSANVRLPYDRNENEFIDLGGDIRINDGTEYKANNLLRFCNINTFDDSVIELGADFMDRRTFGDEYYKKYDAAAPRITLRGNSESILAKIAKTGEAIYDFAYSGSNGATLNIKYKFTVE